MPLMNDPQPLPGSLICPVCQDEVPPPYDRCAFCGKRCERMLQLLRDQGMSEPKIPHKS